MNGILNTRKKLYNVAVISTLRKSTYLDGSLINDIYCEIHTNDLKYLYKKYLNFVYFSNDDAHSFYRFRFVDLETCREIGVFRGDERHPYYISEMDDRFDFDEMQFEHSLQY